MKQTLKKRGRPRAFDDAVVLDRAAKTFLEHGYSAASLDALTSAMGVNKPSLYGAFGDKRGLFLRAVEALVAKIGRRIQTAFERSDTLEGSLHETFLEAVEIYLDGERPPGCLVVSGTTTEAIVDEGFAEFSRQFYARSDHAVAKWIAQRLPPRRQDGSVSALVLSRLVNGVIHDIALRARVGQSRAELREYARGAAIALGRAAG